MHRLIEFIKRIYIVLLFLLIEGIALWTYATATPYTESKILARTTAMGSAVSGTMNDVRNFFALPDQNSALTKRVAQLEAEVERQEQLIAELMPAEGEMPFVDDIDTKFSYHPANVVSMTTNRNRNYIVVDRGTKDGIRENMGVITPNKELVGTVVSCSESYSVVMPLLNTLFKIGGTLVDNDYVCSIYWEGTSRYKVTGVELSRYAEPKKGMVINAKSERVPSDVVIGTIESYEMNISKTAYSVDVVIAADMQRLDNLLIVENRDQTELEQLVESVEN
jgi:rod shape-determining protein MreC